MLRIFTFSLVSLALSAAAQTNNTSKTSPTTAPASKPALTVKWVQPTSQSMSRTLAANGSIAAWAEASVSAEVGGYRLIQVLAQVGDSVKKGQVLAKFSSDSARVELDIAKARVAEADAAAMDAVANAQRARAIEREGFYSAAQLSQIFSLEKAALAQVQAAQSRQQLAERVVRDTDVLAPDDGVVSHRAATLGAVVPQGAELFRLIRQGRLEWRAELTSSEIALIQSGMTVVLAGQGGQAASSGNSGNAGAGTASGLQGKVRMTAPTIDLASRTALAFVDIPAAQAARAGLRAGSFARGEFLLGAGVPSPSLPQSALVLRDGFSYVFVLGAASGAGLHKVVQTKVQTGGRAKVDGTDWVAITGGLQAKAKVVASGAAFLADGDTVKVSQ